MKLYSRLVSVILAPAVLAILILISASYRSLAQCAVSSAPVYSHSCSNEYFDSLIVTGTGVTSTVTVLGITSCRGTYINDFALQGSTAPAGSTVSLLIAKPSKYDAYVSVYVDWDNDGTYAATELAGTQVPMPIGTTDATYNFTVPTSGAVTGTQLHMRVMLSEDSVGAPCHASYGQTYDFFLIIGFGCTMPVVSFRPSSHDTVSNCAGGTGVNIAASGAGIGGAYTWSPSAGLSATTGATVAANPAAATVYTISATSTGTCTATYLDTVVVISTGMPIDSIMYSGGSTFCEGDTILLTGTTGAGYSYRWLMNGIPQRARGPFYQVATAGTYLLVISAYGCTDTSAALVLTTRTPPAPVVTMSGSKLYTGNFFSTYQWYDNGTPVAGATADSIAATTSGFYYVTVTDTNGCTGISSGFSVNKLGVTNINNLPAVTVYPNPADGILHIVSPVAVRAVIMDLEGKIMMEEPNAQDMDISHLAPCLYIIAMYDGQGGRTVQRFIKN